MRIAIFSDIHSNFEALEAALNDAGAQQAERVLCLGDIVGYNANPAECIALLRRNGALCIAGNHDRAVTGQLDTKGFNDVAAKAVDWTRRHLDADAVAYLSQLPTDLVVPDVLIAVHGALHPKEGRETVRLDTNEMRQASFDALSSHPSRVRICAFGHTHQLGIFERHGGTVRKLDSDRIRLHPEALYLVNPGTVGQPRSSDVRATYVILDTKQHEFTTHRVPYDAAIPVAKARQAGLRPFWADLPQPVLHMATRLPKPVRRILKRSLNILRP